MIAFHHHQTTLSPTRATTHSAIHQSTTSHRNRLGLEDFQCSAVFFLPALRSPRPPLPISEHFSAAKHCTKSIPLPVGGWLLHVFIQTIRLLHCQNHVIAIIKKILPSPKIFCTHKNFTSPKIFCNHKNCTSPKIFCTHKNFTSPKIFRTHKNCTSPKHFCTHNNFTSPKHFCTHKNFTSPKKCCTHKKFTSPKFWTHKNYTSPKFLPIEFPLWIFPLEKYFWSTTTSPFSSTPAIRILPPTAVDC